VTTFNLSWKEVVELGRNSLTYSFAEAALKERMLRDYNAAVAAFENRFQTAAWKDTLKSVKPLLSGYAQRSWSIHE
jgi:adenosine deaminase CECR1